MSSAFRSISRLRNIIGRPSNEMKTLNEKYSRKLFLVFAILAILVVYDFLNIEVTDNNDFDRINPTGSCGRYLKDEEIFIDNLIWQILEIPSGFVRLLNAYLDDRNNKTIVRINASGIKLDMSKDKIFCQFWSENIKEPHVVQASEYFLMWDESWKPIKNLHGSQNYPYLITCPLDKTDSLPVSISLTAKPCGQAENKLRIINNQPVDGVKKNFGVCMSHYTFYNRNYGIRFIELIHVLLILGADKVHLYNRYVHPDVYDIMMYFQDLGFIEVSPYLEPQTIVIGDTTTQLVTMLNDCFYRTRNLYKYIIVQDTDEVIVPVHKDDKNWSDLMARILRLYKGSYVDSYLAPNYYFPRNYNAKSWSAPSYLYMLQHIRRSAKNLPTADKSFNVPDRIVSLIAHFSLYCINGARCYTKRVPANIAKLHHYRDTVTGEFLENTVEDWRLWHFRDELVKAVNATLNATNFKL